MLPDHRWLAAVRLVARHPVSFPCNRFGSTALSATSAGAAWTGVDATIINASSSTKNANKARYPEIRPRNAPSFQSTIGFPSWSDAVGIDLGREPVPDETRTAPLRPPDPTD